MIFWEILKSWKYKLSEKTRAENPEYPLLIFLKMGLIPEKILPEYYQARTDFPGNYYKNELDLIEFQRLTGNS